MANRTFYQKLVESHTVTRIDDQNVLLYVDLHLMNEYTSPQAASNSAGVAIEAPTSIRIRVATVVLVKYRLKKWFMTFPFVPTRTKSHIGTAVAVTAITQEKLGAESGEQGRGCKAWLQG